MLTNSVLSLPLPASQPGDDAASPGRARSRQPRSTTCFLCGSLVGSDQGHCLCRACAVRLGGFCLGCGAVLPSLFEPQQLCRRCRETNELIFGRDISPEADEEPSRG